MGFKTRLKRGLLLKMVGRLWKVILWEEVVDRWVGIGMVHVEREGRGLHGKGIVRSILPLLERRVGDGLRWCLR